MTDEVQTKAPAQCTWKAPKESRCQALAVKDEVAEDGQVLARLCPDHAEMWRAAMYSHNAQRLLVTWIAVQGGASAAAKRIQGGAEEAVKRMRGK